MDELQKEMHGYKVHFALRDRIREALARDKAVPKPGVIYFWIDFAEPW